MIYYTNCRSSTAVVDDPVSSVMISYAVQDVYMEYGSNPEKNMLDHADRTAPTR